MEFAKLQQLARTPRNGIDKIGYKPFLIFRKDRRSWEDAMTYGTLVLESVVQANLVLFEPGNEDAAPAVVLYTTYPMRCMDGQWLRATTERVHAVKEDPYPQDPELKEIQNLLRNEQSFFNITLPLGLTGGVATTMQVVTFVPEELPNGFIPEHRLIPTIVGRDGNVWSLKPEAYM